MVKSRKKIKLFYSNNFLINWTTVSQLSALDEILFNNLNNLKRDFFISKYTA